MTSSLIAAVGDCRYIQARLLIDQGVTINCRDRRGSTPLLAALQIADSRRRARMFRWLLQQGADRDYIDRCTGRDLLGWTAFYDCTDELSYLLKTDDGCIDVLWRDKHGRTALHYAALHANSPMVLLLTQYAAKYGLSVDVPDCSGLTPYMLAELLGHDDCEQLLVEEGGAVRGQLILRDPTDALRNVLSELRLSSPLTVALPSPLPPPPLAAALPVLCGRGGRRLTAGRCVPSLLDILSQQTTVTYRPAARPSSRPPPVKRPSTTTTITFRTAAKVSTFAATLRRKRQNRLTMTKGGSKA